MLSVSELPSQGSEPLSYQFHLDMTGCQKKFKLFQESQCVLLKTDVLIPQRPAC